MNNLLEQARESLDVTYAIASYDGAGDAIIFTRFVEIAEEM
jgi:hypothetical protein